MLECRRYPPQTIAEGLDGERTTYFPDIEIDDWCGEWKLPPEPAKDVFFVCSECGKTATDKEMINNYLNHKRDSIIACPYCLGVNSMRKRDEN
jgi:DNA-directed RNA polymerase subunit RPC12/RpoP